MNLDLFLVQKVIHSLFKNNVNATLTTPLDAPLSSSLKPKTKMKENGKERVDEMDEMDEIENEIQENQKKQEKQNSRKLLEVYSTLYDKMNAANVYVNTQKIPAVLNFKK